MSEIDKIVADVETVMTSVLIRAFKALGCNPACHCCGKELKDGNIFKLAMVTTRPYWSYGDMAPSPTTETSDEMLCAVCTPERLIAVRKKNLKDRVLKSQGGNSNGFTRPHKEE